MSSIFSYQKYITREITREFIFPLEGTIRVGTELGTIEGITYVSIPDNIEISQQPEEISVTKIILTDDQKSLIKKNSPHIKLINARVREKIESRYSTTDEIKLIRTKPSQAFDEYNSFVEECRTQGQTEKKNLGL